LQHAVQQIFSAVEAPALLRPAQHGLRLSICRSVVLAGDQRKDEHSNTVFHVNNQRIENSSNKKLF